jgi:hypothetical protein
MKVGSFLDVLRPYAVIAAAHGDERLAARINAFGDVWAPIMSWNVKDLLSRAWPKETNSDADPDAVSVEEFRMALVRLQSVIKTVVKQDIVKDLAAIIGALEAHDRKDLDAFIQACRSALEAAQVANAKPRPAKASAQPANEAVVAEIVQKLRATYKDPAHFAPIFERISKDKTLTQADIAAVATVFAYNTPAKTKKRESLSRIWLVHESYVTSAAKSRSSGGKSAA